MAKFRGLDRSTIFLEGGIITMTEPAYWVGQLSMHGANDLAIDALVQGMSTDDESLLNRAVLMHHMGR